MSGAAEAVEIRGLPAVPGAAGVDEAEQARGRGLPRQLGELVDGADDQRGREAVDLLVHGEHGQPLPRGQPPGEQAVALRIAAVQQHPAQGVIRRQVAAGRQRGAAPGARDELQRAADRAFLASGVVDLPPRLVVGVGGDLAADPQADAKRRAAPSGVAALDAFAPQHLAGADERRRPLELLGGEQAQRVAHEHRHPSVPSRASSPSPTTPCSRRIANV